VSHPDGLPDLFLDRSLGRVKVPSLLRDAGLRLITLAEHYGIPADEHIPDAEWLELAGRRRWVVFAKDKRVRYNPAERAAIERFEVRYFYLSGRSLNATEMAKRFLRNLDRIVFACANPGPLVYAVHKNRIEQIPFGR
jgi:hypothetical protein